MDYGIFNMRTDVNACDCARGCTDTVRESALKVDSVREFPHLASELGSYPQKSPRAHLHMGGGRLRFMSFYIN